MTRQARGPFEVKLAPQPMSEGVESPPLGRYSIDKQFHGDLEAKSRGEMLSTGTDTEGSAGYVAIERVTGTLGGLAGSFALMHTGVMKRGVPQLTISVVPDSGTGALEGLEGTMAITITDGKHGYTFDYTLGHDAPAR